MKKLVVVALVVFAFSAYGITFGVGGAYENLATGDSLDKAYFGLKGDATIDLLPLLSWRVGLLNIELPEGFTSFILGTGISSDILINLPVPSPIKPYGVLGFVFNMEMYKDTLSADNTAISFKGGLGGKMSFTPMLGFYIEGGINYISTSSAYANTTITYSEHPLYFQGGILINVPLGK